MNKDTYDRLGLLLVGISLGSLLTSFWQVYELSVDWQLLGPLVILAVAGWCFYKGVSSNRSLCGEYSPLYILRFTCRPRWRQDAKPKGHMNDA